MDGNYPTVIIKIKNVYSLIVRQRWSDGRWHSKTLLIIQLWRVSSSKCGITKLLGLSSLDVLRNWRRGRPWLRWKPEIGGRY